MATTAALTHGVMVVDYRVTYNALDSPGVLDGLFPGALLGFVLLGVLWALVVRHGYRRHGRISRAEWLATVSFFGGAILVFPLFWIGERFTDIHQHKQWLENGDYRIAEGTVTGYGTRSHGKGGVWVTFTVNEQTFSVPQSNAQRLQKGSLVRVAHHGDAVLRLEVADANGD